MRDSLKITFFVILSAMALLVLSTIAEPRALGQEISAPRRLRFHSPTSPSKPDSGSVTPISAASQCNHYSSCACSPGDYWIVSSRNCAQRGNPCRETCHCRLEHFHSTPDGCVHTSSEQSFLQSLQPGVPVCIVVHGSFTSWETLTKESKHVHQWIRGSAPEMPVHVVFFTWPSDGPYWFQPHIGLGILGRRSAYNGFYLAHLISRLPETSPVSLVGHSHGARTVSSTLHLLGGGKVQGHYFSGAADSRHRIRAVLFGAALDRHWLEPGERYGNAVCRAEYLLNLRNRRDLTLLIYPMRKFFSGRSLARAGFLGEIVRGVTEVDVTSLVQTGHFWHHYYDKPKIAESMVPYIYYPDDRSATSPASVSMPDRDDRRET